MVKERVIDMTELQFERVFNRAQDLQVKSLEHREAKEAERVLQGFESGEKKVATTTQAAYILNVVCMDMGGNYSADALARVKDLYIENVSIKGEKKNSKKKKK